MFAETPSEAFNINSLLEDSHQIVGRSNEPMKKSVISKKFCQELYPHHAGVDGESFYGLVVRFRDRHFAEKLVSSCDFDFSLAHRIGTLCHGNIFLLDRLCVLFSNDLSLALRFFDCFPSPLSSSSFLLGSRFLSFFKNDVSSASTFLSNFRNDVSQATNFLSRFNNNGSSASSFCKRFTGFSEAEQALEQIPSKFSEESSFELALCGCNGDISAVEAFSALSGINHLELLYDSDLHPRTGQAFHSRCDDRGPTVSFFCYSGNCVCGVVQSSWISPPVLDVQYVSDSSAFLLRLSPNPHKFPIKSKEAKNALFCESSLGPSFGENDIVTVFTTNVIFPKGMGGLAFSKKSFDLPKNGFLFPTTDNEKLFPIDRIVVCKFTQ